MSTLKLNKVGTCATFTQGDYFQVDSHFFIQQKWNETRRNRET